MVMVIIEGVVTQFVSMLPMTTSMIDCQVCLLGTGDIDRRRSCMSEGGFRLIFISANLHLVCRPPTKATSI